MYKILTIILSRTGSKGLPGKALKTIKGRSLIGITIYDAKNAGLDDGENDIYFGYDMVNSQLGEDYKKEALKHDIKTINRPCYMVDDYATVEESLKFVLYVAEENNNKKYDYVAYMQVTDLFRTPEMISDCIKNVKTYGHIDSSFVVTKTHKNYWREVSPLNYEPIAGIENNYGSRQFKDPLYREDTGLFLISKSDIIRESKRIAPKERCCFVVNHNENQCFDIHTEDDLAMARAWADIHGWE